MKPTPPHESRDLLFGNCGGFTGIAAPPKQFPLGTAGTSCRRLLTLIFVGFVLTLSPVVAVAVSAEEQGFAASQAKTKKDFKEYVEPFINTYCADCHGLHKMEGGITFSAALKAPGVPSSAKSWNQALAHVKTHDMPPEDVSKQPTDEERQRFIDWVGAIKFLSPKDPGEFVIRRLTKVEYANTLRDLFGVDPAVAAELPNEVFGAGYLNSLSPLQSEQYLIIANEVLDQILAPAGSPPTEVQKRIFGDEPAPGSDLRKAARTVASKLARNAYRRPASEAELDLLMRVFDLAQENQLDYPASLRLMLKAVLVSPQFLFITPASEAAPGKTIVPLDDYQLASRLSYLLWATMPDAELSALADNETLHDAAIYQTQVQRLLADPRSRALFDGFGAQWLGLMDLETKTFDTAMFPQMTGEMRAAMYDEGRLFFDSMIRENRSVVGFVDSDYTRAVIPGQDQHHRPVTASEAAVERLDIHGTRERTRSRMGVDPDPAELFRSASLLHLRFKELGHGGVIELHCHFAALLVHQLDVLNRQQLLGRADPKPTDFRGTEIPQIAELGLRFRRPKTFC